MKQFFTRLILASLLFSTFALRSQETCIEKLIQANNLYEKGSFNEAINIATSCTHATLTSDKWKAYRLLAVSYLALNEKENATEAAAQMLRLNPTYKPSIIKDPAELAQLLKHITVIPKFSVGIALSIGPNATFPQIKSVYGVNNAAKKYYGKNSVMFGLSSGYNFTKNLSIELSLISSTKVYEIEYAFNEWENKVREKLTYLDIPVQARYTFFTKSGIHPFLQAGVYGGILLFANNDFHATYLPKNQTYELLTISSITRRNNTNAGVSGGIGVAYKLSDGILSLQANYYKSNTNITKSDTRYKYNELLYTYYYIDDDILLSNFAISVGYAFNLNYKVIHKK